MNKAMWDRWAPFSGIVFVGLIVATFFSPSKTPPDAGDSAETWVSFIQDHRTALLIATYLSGLALVFFLFFLGSLASRLRDAGEQRLAAVTLGGGLVLAALALVEFSIKGALAWNLVNELEAGDVKMLSILPMFGYAFPLVAFAAAASVGAWRGRLWPQWFSLVGLVAAVWFLVGGATFARDGFFSPQGAYGFIGFLAFLVWMLLASAFLLVRSSAEHAPAAAPSA